MIRTLSILDVPQAAELSNLAGWNQTTRDWQRILLLEPHGCFCFVKDGRVVATTTAVRYEGRLAWIGMVLTHPDFRRLGLARQLMLYTLQWLRSRGVAFVKLDATDQGRPLYESLGFAGECKVERWVRAPEVVPTAVPLLPKYPAFQMDRKTFGLARTDLFNLLREESWTGSPDIGFAFSRPGALGTYFGPCVATSDDNAQRMLDWCCALNPDKPLYWDLFSENQAAREMAEARNFRPARQLVRMSLSLQEGESPPATNLHSYYAIAGFEYG